jgi:hypothetical protein
MEKKMIKYKGKTKERAKARQKVKILERKEK